MLFSEVKAFIPSGIFLCNEYSLYCYIYPEKSNACFEIAIFCLTFRKDEVRDLLDICTNAERIRNFILKRCKRINNRCEILRRKTFKFPFDIVWLY